MNKSLIILIFIVTCFGNCYAQNDTLYLKSDHILFKGCRYNQEDSTGNKIGKWLGYEVTEFITISSMASGYIEETLMDAHWHSYFDIVYRPLREGEVEEEHVVLTENTDTINYAVYTIREGKEIRSKIARDTYTIIEEGEYVKNKKEGIWNYFYRSGSKLKTVYYSKGIPLRNYHIYRDSGSIMMKVEILGSSIVKVTKFSSDGKRLGVKLSDLDDFKMLY